MLCPKMTDQTNLGTECSYTCQTDMCSHCNCWLMWCFNSVHYSLSLTALIDKATPGSEVFLQHFIVTSGKPLMALCTISFILHISIFQQKELFGYVLFQHMDDMSCPQISTLISPVWTDRRPDGSKVCLKSHWKIYFFQLQQIIVIWLV